MKIFEYTGLITIFCFTIYIASKIYVWYWRRKLNKQIEIQTTNHFKKLHNTVRSKHAFMKRHLDILDKIISEYLKIESDDVDRIQVLDDYHNYLGLYEKIKTNQEMSENDSIEFSKLYMIYTDLINTKQKVEQETQNRIKELYTISLN